jgi:GNAT superfamily N-acetyltransferase
MPVRLQSVTTPADLETFAAFPFRVYQDDPFWVPPVLTERIDRLTPGRNPFWNEAERALWIAQRGGEPVGTIAAIIDHKRNRVLGTCDGQFGFFECRPDQEAAAELLNAAAGWLAERGMERMLGPYNPSPTDEIGILIDGFDTRPAILEAHTPRYYRGLVEACGLVKQEDLVARLYTRSPYEQDVMRVLPEKLVRAAELAGRRPDLALRPVNLKRWDDEIALAQNLYDRALGILPGHVPFSLEEFRAFAAGFKPVVDPKLALIAEVGGQPAGFALALPDANEALQPLGGKLGRLELLRLWWGLKRVKRVSLKILVVLPEYHYRGVEAALLVALAKGIWERGYHEVDMSMTGEDNWRSNRFQENLGFKVYRRYRVYQKELSSPRQPN